MHLIYPKVTEHVSQQDAACSTDVSIRYNTKGENSGIIPAI
jgi:hypothetical protein